MRMNVRLLALFFVFVVLLVVNAAKTMYLPDVLDMLSADSKVKYKIEDKTLYALKVPSSLLLSKSFEEALYKLADKLDWKKKDGVYFIYSRQKKNAAGISGFKTLIYSMDYKVYRKVLSAVKTFGWKGKVVLKYDKASGIAFATLEAKLVREFDRVVNLVLKKEEKERNKQKKEPKTKMTDKVMIKAYIVAIDISKMKEEGFDWNFEALYQAPSRIDTFWPFKKFERDTSLSSSPGELNFENFGTLLRLLEDKSIAKTYSEPSVVVSSGRSAKLEVGKRVPYLKSTIVNNGVSSTDVEYMDVGIKLNVTPIVEGDKINLDLALEVSEVVGEGVNSSPIVSSRKAETTLWLKDGEGIVIGGLFKKVATLYTKKVPFFGDLPLISNAFRKKKKSYSWTNLYLFLFVKRVGGEGKKETAKKLNHKSKVVVKRVSSKKLNLRVGPIVDERDMKSLKLKGK